MTASSLRSAFEFLGMPMGSGFPRSLPGVRPQSMAEFIAACRDPRIAEWSNPSRGWAENKSFSEEAQGMATDGEYWYVSNNANDGREAVRRLDWDLNIKATLDSPFDPDAVHVGALGVRDGWVYVALQKSAERRGVWKISTDFAASVVLWADSLPDDDMFAWCDLNPHSGLLYTCAYSMPSCLRAYRDTGDSLAWLREADVPIVQPGEGGPTTQVQGGCFTARHKWLAVCDDPGVERIHCHSTLTGTFLGRRSLPANTDESGSVLPTSTRNELEDIWVYPLTSTKGVPVQVHVLELNNEELSADDLYLWHLSVPEPDTL